MLTRQDIIGLQAERHPLVVTDAFQSDEELCLHLMHRKAYETALEFADGRTVLDLGCNNGYGTSVIREKARRVVGADVSRRALLAAKAALPDEGVDFVAIDGTGLPFVPRSFGLIVSFQVIEHVENVGRYLDEITRVLAPGGFALFTTPNASLRLDPGMKPWNEFHVREYAAPELEETLRSHFSKVEVKGLLAIEELYEVEANRVRAARMRARRSLHRSTAVRALRGVTRHLLSHLPRPIRTGFRGADSTRPTARDSRYSTADFYYVTGDLDRSLDLLAICSSS